MFGEGDTLKRGERAVWKVIFSRSLFIRHSGFHGLAQPVIESVLEAYEFANQRVVSAVGLVAFGSEEVVEVEFRVNIVLRERFDQACFCQPRACHTDEAGGGRLAVFTMIQETLGDPLRAGKSGNERVDFSGVHGVPAGP